MYGSSSQNDNQLERICSDLKNVTLSRLIFIDIDAKTSKIVFHWQSYKAIITKDDITSTTVYNQMINTPTHFTNISSSCTDSTFFLNTSCLTTGMEQSIYDKYHHNIICEKLNFDIPLPPFYYKKTWDYIMANTEDIQRSI